MRSQLNFLPLRIPARRARCRLPYTRTSAKEHLWRSIRRTPPPSGGSDPHEAPPNDLERFRLELMALRGETYADKQMGEALLKAYDEALAKHKTAE